MASYDGVIASGAVGFATGSTSSIPLPSGAACSTPGESVTLSLVLVRVGLGPGHGSNIRASDIAFTGGFQPIGTDYGDCLPFDGWYQEFFQSLIVVVTRYMKVMLEEIAPGGTIEVPVRSSGSTDAGTLYYLVEQFRGLDGELGTPSLTAGDRRIARAGSNVHGTPPPFFTGTTSDPYTTGIGGLVGYEGVVTVPPDTGLASNIQIATGYCTPGYHDGECNKVRYPNLLKTGTAFASVPFGLTGYDSAAFSIINTLSGNDAPSGSTVVPGPFPWEVSVAHCLNPAPGTIPLGASWAIGPYDRVLICGSHIDPLTGHIIFGVVETPTQYSVLGVSFPYAAGGGPALCAPPSVDLAAWERL